MEIIVDTRQQAGKHEKKHRWLEGHGCKLVRRKLDVGDYMAAGNDGMSIDTKQDVDEIAMNINGRQHARFREEIKRAATLGVRLIVLVENIYGYGRIEDVAAWTNTHCKMCALRYQTHGRACNPRASGKCPRHKTNKPIQGARLAKAMKTMEARYGVEFRFCHPNDAGRVIYELLGGGSDDAGNRS